MDDGLSFLDDYVNAARLNGAKSYAPPADFDAADAADGLTAAQQAAARPVLKVSS